MAHYGIQCSGLDLFERNLKERRQVLCVDSELSPLPEIKCGVLHDSILGPLLFLISVNDLLSSVAQSSKVCMPYWQMIPLIY